MEPTITAAIVGALGALGGALLRPVVAHRLEQRRVTALTVPPFTKTWRAEWYVDGELLVADTVMITKQQGVHFKGVGSGGGDQYPSSYELNGQFNSHGIATFSYDFGLDGYAMVGAGVMKVAPSYTECEGRWHGYTQSGDLVSGKVTWTAA